MLKLVHEINTPLGVLNNYNDSVLQFLDKIEHLAADPDSERSKKIVNAMESLTNANKRAVERILGILTSLKSFSRIDRAPVDRVDVHIGLKSALALVQPGLKGNVRVVQEYGDLPKIKCHPTELNQAFMTLLINAFEAMEGEGVLRITTKFEDNQIVVEIFDTEQGIGLIKLTTSLTLASQSREATGSAWTSACRPLIA